MPHLRCHDLCGPDVERLSLSLIEPLASLLGCEPAAITLERVESTFVAGGWPVSPGPLLEVAWFAREQEVQDAVAALITDQVRAIVGEPARITVLFQRLERHCYYRNGRHL